jgi:hypothetical protein
LSRWTSAVDPITDLERISLTHVGPIAGHDDRPIREAVSRAARFVARQNALFGFTARSHS